MPEDTKLPLASSDPAADLLAQLREAVPQVFSEGRVDFDKLRTALGGQVDAGPERYGLTWAGKSDAFRNVQAPSVGTLLPMREESVNWDSTENLIIEGDNLEVLKLLQKSYHGKVKMIYIDPPYNTGNDFVYLDDYRQALDRYLRYSGQISEEGIKLSTNTDTSGRFHSDWLSMMYPRLFLARNLLRDDGVIFVSIDDNEMHNLRLVMNEVFGEENFMAAFIWHRRQNPDSRNQDRVSPDHEYALLYKRNQAKLRGRDVDLEKYTNPDNDPRGRWFSADLTGLANKEQRPNLHYDVVNPKTGVSYSPSPTRGWSCSKDTFQKYIDADEIIWPRTPTGRPRFKKFLKDVENFQTGFSTILDVGFTTEGTKQLQELFEGKILQFPKPLSLLKQFLEQTLAGDDLVLDFFAGSGTTAQAALELNHADGGNRKFILVQLPEPTDVNGYPTIAHITRERVRRVTTKLNEENGSASNRGFRSFKLSSSNFKIWDAEKTPDDAGKLAEQLKLYTDNVEGKRGPEDILYELILKSGLPLSSKVEKVEVAGKPAWSVNGGELFVYLDKPVTREVLRGMLALKPQRMLCLDAAFGNDDALKTNTVLEARSQGVAFHTV